MRLDLRQASHGSQSWEGLGKKKGDEFIKNGLGEILPRTGFKDEMTFRIIFIFLAQGEILEFIIKGDACKTFVWCDLWMWGGEGSKKEYPSKHQV